MFRTVAMYMGSTVFTFFLVYYTSKKTKFRKLKISSDYAKSSLSIKCQPMKCLSMKRSYLWNVLSMKCPIYEMSYLWNIISMKCLLWNVLSMKCPLCEMSYQWNVISLKCPINEMSYLWNVFYEMFFYEMTQHQFSKSKI